MSVRVLFFASLADIVGARERSVEVAALGDTADVIAIFNRFAAEFPALEAHRHSLLFALNSEFARSSSQVRDGDEVAFLPPVSGG